MLSLGVNMEKRLFLKFKEIIISIKYVGMVLNEEKKLPSQESEEKALGQRTNQLNKKKTVSVSEDAVSTAKGT